MSGKHAFFYNSVSGDRVYDADSFSDWLKKFFTTGVFIGDLQVLAGEGMQIMVQTGYCNINGKVMMWDEQTTLDVSTANATYDRIDTVVAERNDTDRDFTLKVITGSAGETPTANPPLRKDAVYQLVLAQIYVKAGITAITQADITDKRPDETVCGFVAATVKEIDFSQIQAQYDAYMKNYKRATQQDFDTWFDSIKGKLDGDIATQLAKEISATNAAVNRLNHVTEVTLTANGWEGTDSFVQMVSVPDVTEDMEPLLVSALPDDADAAAQKAYTKAFGIISCGTATVGNGTVIFKAYKKPATDCKIGLKGV